MTVGTLEQGYPLLIVRRCGKQRLTSPRGRLRGHQVTREGNIYRDIISGSGPREKVSDPSTYDPGPLRSPEWDPDPSK
jgi:hypothetical protein